MKRLAVLFLLTGCLGYQASPYAEVQYRDENLGSHQPTSQYDGTTYMVGVRYQPPMRISSSPDGWLPPHYDHETSTTTVNLPKVEAPKGVVGEIKELAEVGKDADGNWTAWGAVIVLGILLAYVVLRRPKVQT